MIGFGVFRQVKANQVQKEAAAKIQQIEQKKAEIARDLAKLQAVRQRCDEVQRTVRELTGQLNTTLSSSNPTTPDDVQRIIKIVKTLRAAIDEPVIPAVAASQTAERRASTGRNQVVSGQRCYRCGKQGAVLHRMGDGNLRCSSCIGRNK